MQPPHGSAPAGLAIRSRLSFIDLPIGHAVESVLIDDEATWARVKTGELGSFSVGGRGKREVVTEAP